MIPFDFAYYKPATVDEAVGLYESLRAQGKRPAYFAGGTEWITLGRISEACADAVIDIKGIGECQALQVEDGWLTMGAALTLTRLQESGRFPLLGRTVGEISDRTARNKITLGGNICGQIYYREAVLPLLVADTEIVIAGKRGRRRAALGDGFDGRPRLEDGELIVQLLTRADDLGLPFYHVKHRRQWDVGYPLLTAAALVKEGDIRVALSGVCPFPFRSRRMEACLNDAGASPEARVDEALRQLPKPVSSDVEGSPDYRLFVLRNTLLDILRILEGQRHAHR